MIAAASACEACDGTGSVEHVLTEDEYQELRRKKIKRGVFLLILGLIPLIVLLISIFSQNPDLIFGSWWY
jgi:predicted nucleic acid binding AN1-type Zn finger protein